MKFLSCNEVIPKGIEKLESNSNFFLGSEPTNWATDVPNYKTIVYENLYDKIDLIFQSVPEGLKYEFIIHPGGRVQDIKLKYNGAGLSTDDKNLFLQTPLGQITDGELFVYQNLDGKQISKSTKILVNENVVSYEVDYDMNNTLVIDPLIYSTYLGGLDKDKAYSVAVDTSNNAYITGNTWSLNFPTTPGAYNDTHNGSKDIFVSKLNSTGKGLVFSTFVGGTYNDEARDIVLDSSNNIYVTGYTESTNFPTTSSVVNLTYNGGLFDIIVFKLNSTGNGLGYSTYFGGGDYEYGMSIILDSSNNAYVTGYTWSDDFPTSNGAVNRTLNGWEDAFVIKFNAAGSSILYSTLLGGSSRDFAYSIVVDSSRNAYVTGTTYSQDFPTTLNAFNSSNNGSSDIFVFKLNPTGTSLIYSTYIGGTKEDQGRDIALDSSNHAYITGWTWSADFPLTPDAYDQKKGTWTDAVIFRLNAAGSKLVYSTFIGGSEEDYGNSIALDSSKNAYITGYTLSSDFPTTIEAYDTNSNKWEDGFVLILNSSGKQLMYSTFIGGSEEDYAQSIFLDSLNNGYITGYTVSSDFPTTPGAIDSTYNDYEDVFVFKLEFPPVPDTPQNLSTYSGDQFVKIQWDPPSNIPESSISSYFIYKGTSKNNMKLQKSLDSARVFNDSDVINGETYYYAISAINSMGEGDKNTIVQATPGAPPSKPQGLLVAAETSFIKLNWNPPLNTNGFQIKNYRIYRGFEEHNLSIHDTIGLETEYFDTTVISGIVYYYGISAINLKGESTLSDVITSAPGNPPSEPKNLTAERVNKFVYLTWSPPENNGGFNVNRYRIYRGLTKSNLSLIGETDIISYLDTTTDVDQTYYFSVSGVNVKGEGIRSNPVETVQYTSNTGGAVVPVDPILTGIVGDSYVKLSWTMEPEEDSNPEILYFKVYRGTLSQPTQLIGLTTELFYFDYNVTINVVYSYFVSAFSDKGEGLKSNIFNARPVGLPSQPQNITANPQDGFVLLYWSPPETTGALEILQYNIYKGENKWNMHYFRNTTETFFNDSYVTNRNVYFYSISALNEKGESPRSEYITAKPKGLPKMVINLTINSGDREVFLSWQPKLTSNSTEILWYVIYRGFDGHNITHFTKVFSTYFNDTEVLNGVFYYYRISAVNEFGEGPLSDLVRALPGAIAESPENLKLEIKEGKIMLTWDPPKNTGGFLVEGYKIYRGIGEDNLQEIAYVEDTIYLDKYFLKGILYYYKISAVTQNGEGIHTDKSSILVEEDLEENPVEPVKEDDQDAMYQVLLFGIIVIFLVLIVSIILIFMFVNRKLQIKAKISEAEPESKPKIEHEHGVITKPKPGPTLVRPKPGRELSYQPASPLKYATKLKPTPITPLTPKIETSVFDESTIVKKAKPVKEAKSLQPASNSDRMVRNRISPVRPAEKK
jgi:hypothetical protein